ncbi:unnamed protein product [Spirodela intermedia]|uniref:Nucleoside phosphorylase domain-containing protein n=1 Tax=Spirodela intermedia TaxID=51605 RepID=A0A7I8J856_SPIIN|nr:unnamed protein product [Spirodela intermedia]CAA6665925.1 unnamed protein product [Spirodela intermedia]
MGEGIWALCVVLLAVATLGAQVTYGDVPTEVQKKINSINQNGTYLGVVIPNAFELNPLLQSPSYSPDKGMPYVDFAGRRFRFGSLEGKKVILVMTGLGMINAATTTQLLLGLFKVEGVVQYGIAGNANPSFIIGDVVIPRFWAHSALWSWQRYGDGPKNELPFENTGDYTRKYGFLKFADYTQTVKSIPDADNLLNNVWYQPEEIFPVDGIPEESSTSSGFPLIPGLKLKGCVNSTLCLTRTPNVARVTRGMSASIFLDNAAYRDFLFSKFKFTPVDMESASVALVCHQQRIPFIIIRGLSDLAGGGSDESNEADTFVSLAAENTITAVVEFIKRL